MKLFYGKGACSLAPHIVLHEGGFKFETTEVNMRTKEMTGGGDYREVNRKGSVPALKLDNGEILTENAVILQYIADQKPEANLFPKQGTMERYRAQEWLNFVATELHKSFSIFFSDKSNAEYRTLVTENLGKRFDILSATLGKQDYILGANFSIIDAYLFTVLNWAGFLKIDLSKWPALTSFMNRMQARPSVQAALRAEGLQK